MSVSFGTKKQNRGVHYHLSRPNQTRIGPYSGNPLINPGFRSWVTFHVSIFDKNAVKSLLPRRYERSAKCL